MKTPDPCTNPAFWGWVSAASSASPSTLQVLTRVRRGDDLADLSQAYPGLSADQLGLARHLQAQEQELNRLYRDIQAVEERKLRIEREFTQSLSSSPIC